MRKLLMITVSMLILASGCITLAGGPSAGEQKPVINSFGANPATIQQGSSATLNWNVAGASSVTLDNGIGNVALSGTVAVAPAANTVYMLTASNSAGSSSATTQVIVSGGGTPAPTPAPPSTPNAPSVNLFNTSPNTISYGGTSTLSWSVSNATSISIDQGIGSVAANGSRAVSPAGTTVYTLTAANAGGTIIASSQVVVSGGAPPSGIPPLLPLPHLIPITLTIYDFVAQAATAAWQSNVNLTFPGIDTDNRGFALWRNNFTLEDNNVYPQVLETHPQWVTGGIMQGAYVAMAGTYKVEAGDHFLAKVGFIKGASAGNVRFRVMIRTGAGNFWIADVPKAYSGDLKTIDIPLAAYAGTKPDFILEVDANNPNATQDWAVWADAKIIR
jgi:hypothetical protein